MSTETDKYALHQAARDGNVTGAQSLLEANPKQASVADDDGRLPIHWAVSYNHRAIVELLIQHTKSFDPDVQDSLGWTPLMMAASRPEGTELAELLISRGANVNEKNNNNQTALHFASSKITLPTVTLLLAHKASARVRDTRQQLPIHRAAAVGSVPVLKRLLAAGSPLDSVDVDGCTPLHHAVAEGHADAALFLILEGADTSKKDADGRFALDTAPDAKVRSFIVEGARNAGWDERIWSVVEDQPVMSKEVDD